MTLACRSGRGTVKNNPLVTEMSQGAAWSGSWIRSLHTEHAASILKSISMKLDKITMRFFTAKVFRSIRQDQEQTCKCHCTRSKSMESISMRHHLAPNSSICSPNLIIHNYSNSVFFGYLILVYHFPSRFRILGSPFLGGCNSGLLILLPALGDICSERVIRVRSTEEGLDRQEDSSDLKSGRPVICSVCELGRSRHVCILICNPLLRTSRQIRPSLSTFGWKILVRNRILGGVIG